MNIYVIGLGCAKNKVDLEVILGNLLDNNFKIVSEIKKADIIWVNTCAFIDDAKQEAIDTILNVIDYKGKNKKIIVSGCLSTRYMDDLPELLPEVDLFIPIKDYPKIPTLLNELVGKKVFSDNFDTEKRALSSKKESVYVKISEGCNNRCSYCAIPLIRGNFVSRDYHKIINEVRELVKNGAVEINLISQDTTNYGFDLKEDYNIVNLLSDIEKIEGNFKIRLLYLYPSLVTDELISYIKNSKKVMHYFDIPLQHSESRLLKEMNRHSDKDFNTKMLLKIKEEIKDAILRTTFIVGFPGETEEEFNQLVSYLKEIKFDRMGAFIYSKEEGTKGALMDNQIDEDIKKKRLEILYNVQDDISYELNKKNVGNITKVFIEEYDEKNYAYIGRNYAYAPDDIDGFIYVYSEEELQIGAIYDVLILDCDINTLSGKVVNI